MMSAIKKKKNGIPEEVLPIFEGIVMYQRNRSLFILLCVFMTLIIGGCHYRIGSIENVTMENFDINTAIKMIEELEIPILRFESDSIFTKRELTEMQNKYEIFSSGVISPENFFDVAYFLDTSIYELAVLGHSRFMTVFDKDIEVTRSYIETTTFQGHTVEDARVELHIVLEYIGDDANIMNYFNGFRNWGYLRRYIFIPDDTGGWILNKWTPISGFAVFTLRDS